jgi:hypothetical protein
MTVSAEVQAAISRYLLEVSMNLGSRTPGERRELLTDLEAHIHEALSRRGREPTLSDLETVLAEMAAPESYAAGEESPGRSSPQAPARTSTATLASWALALAIGGFVGPLALAALNPHGGGVAVLILFPVLELTALVLGILSWRERMGKAAVVLAAVLIVVVMGGLAFFWLYRNTAMRIEDFAAVREAQRVEIAGRATQPSGVPQSPLPPAGAAELAVFSALADAAAPRIASAFWDQDHTLTLTVTGNFSAARHLAAVVGWGYGKADVPKDSPFEVDVAGLGTLHWAPITLKGLYDLDEQARQDQSAAPGPQSVSIQHFVIFAPFKVNAEDARGGVLEFIPQPITGAAGPQRFTLALPLFAARGRMGGLSTQAGDLQPVFVLLMESPYSKASAMAGVRFGVDDLPPEEWGASAVAPPAEK